MDQDGVISISRLQADSAEAERLDSERFEADREEGLDITPQRSLLHKVSYPPRMSLNGLLISLLCLLLLVMMGFIPVPLPSPLNLGAYIATGHWPPVEQTQWMQYNFQIPLALLIAALLGPFMGTGAVLLFLVIGMGFFPVFANGGGWHYITEPGFGYLPGTLFAASLLGKTFHKTFQKQNNISRSVKLLAKALAAVFQIHALGVLYLTALSLTGQVPWGDWPGWVLRLTVETAPYDFIATFVFLCLVRQFRLALWLVLY